MNKGIGSQTRSPVSEVPFSVIRGTVMLKDSIENIAINQFVECMEFFALIEFILTEPDLSFDFFCPVFSLSFPLEMIADCGVTFYADDRTPAFAVFSLINRCHSRTLCYMVEVRLNGVLVKTVFHCTVTAP
jgi:hypothetical protein